MLLAFCGTGLYMDRVHNHLRGMTDARRMLFRSDHIYLLLSALVNLALGLYMTPNAAKRARVVQNIGSLAILIAPLLFLTAFFTEPWLAQLARPYTRPAIYLIFGGGLAHLLAAYTVDVRT